MTDTCYLCGSEAHRVWERRSVPVAKRRRATIDDEIYRCGTCGEGFYVGDMAGESFRRAADAVRAEDGLLAPEDILALRKKYDLAAEDLEQLIGSEPRTIERWERGQVAHSRTVDVLFRVLLANPDVAADLAHRRGVELSALEET